jgi:hypothetical protein
VPKPKIKRKVKSKDETTPAKDEHIFPQSQLVPLALRWQELNAKGKHTAAMLVLEQVIVLATPMFERLAQHEEYHNTVKLGILVSAAQEKVIKWLLKWQPKKGRLFSWFSKCAKHAFLSELVKVNQYNRRYFPTGENLEKFHGTEDHESDKHDMTAEFNRSLKDLYCRWGNAQEQGALRYLCECLVHDLDDHDKQAAIRGAAYAWGISMEMSKFFYSWVLVALRDIHYSRIRMPFTEEDILRHWLSHTNFVNLFERFTLDQIKWLMATHGGQRLKIPSLAQFAKAKEDYAIFTEIEKSDKDPDAIAAIAKKRKRTPRSAQDAFAAMVEITNPNRSGEYPLYGNDDPGFDTHRN